MRFHAVIGCFAVAFLPQLALAARPPGEVGALQAVFAFCAKVDSTERTAYDRQADSLFKGLTPREIASLRQSTEYKRGYQTLAGILPEIKDNEAVVACQAISDVPKAKHGPTQRPQ
jgi:hypothetical protein